LRSISSMMNNEFGFTTFFIVPRIPID
jgi:hypothetical protein